MLFRSRLCGICQTTLQKTFETLDDLSSNKIPHHPTKESLVDSVLHRSCHLYRLIVHHLRLRWAPLHRLGLEDLETVPTSLTKSDFEDSDFDFETFASDRIIVLEYMLELPESCNFNAHIKKYVHGVGGEPFYHLEFDCDGPDSDKPRFWVSDEKVMVFAMSNMTTIAERLAFGMSPVTSRLNEETSAASCQHTVKTWLKQCSSHENCKMQSHLFLPTRFLDIGDVEAGGLVRLVPFNDLEPGSRYATLSHSWGENVPFQSRAETMEHMMEGFEVTEMPRTFRDAIAVAGWANSKSRSKAL